MATAVTLKESDGSEIYPVTDISLVNNGIHAVDIEATTPVPAVETAMIADGAITDAKLANAKVDVASINLNNQTTTLLAQVTALAAADIDYARFACTYDGASSGIPDKPTGSTNASFVCVAYRTRANSSTSWRYALVCYVKEQINPWYTEVWQQDGSPSIEQWTQIPQIETSMIANGAVTFAKINPQSMWGGLSGGYTGNISGLYVKIMRLDLSAVWKDAVVRFTFASTQSDSFAYDVMLRVARNDAIRSVNLTAWSLQSTSHDLASRLKLVAISSTQFELYWQSDSTSSGMATVYSFTTLGHGFDSLGKITMYMDSTASALPAGTVYSCTVKNNLIS